MSGKKYKIPSTADSIKDLKPFEAAKDTTPEGPMAPYLGRRYRSREFKKLEANEDTPLHILDLVRAYEVISLTGATFRVQSDIEINAGLTALLHEKCTGIDWKVKEDWSGSFRKYQIIHGYIELPEDTDPYQPMAMEIYGRLVEIDGINLESPEGHAWIDDARRTWNKKSSVDSPDNATFVESYPPIKGDMLIQIVQATYANVLFPGINMPFYM